MRHEAQFVSPDDIGPSLVAREISCSAGGLDVQPEGPAGSVRSKSNCRPSTTCPSSKKLRDAIEAHALPARSTRVTKARVTFATTACRANTSGIPTVAAISTWCQVDYALPGGLRETISRPIAIARQLVMIMAVATSIDGPRPGRYTLAPGGQSLSSCPHEPAKRKWLHEPAVLRPPFSGT